MGFVSPFLVRRAGVGRVGARMVAEVGEVGVVAASHLPERVSPHYFEVGCYYFLILFLLYAWEMTALPRLQDAGMMPCEKEKLLPSDKKTKWILPSYADTPVPLPTLSSLPSLQPLYVGYRPGSRNTKTKQYISLKSSSDIPLEKGICEVSEEWSTYYGEEIVIFKRK